MWSPSSDLVLNFNAIFKCNKSKSAEHARYLCCFMSFSLKLLLDNTFFTKNNGDLYLGVSHFQKLIIEEKGLE